MNDLAERIARLTDAQRRILAARLGITSEAPAAPEDDDAVAIIGMGCRLAGGIDSPESFWEALCAGRDLISETPADRWSADEWYDADPAAPGTTNSRWGGYLDDVAGFDRRYFRISADEAARMDPQQRQLLETAFSALADAGVTAASLAGTDTGVYMASMTDDYTWLQAADPALVTVHTGTGTQRSILANRLSYELDLRGPSIAMDTACSSSLAAVHLACQSIRTGESEVALAGGVNVMVSPVTTVIYAKLGMLAPDGRCKTFDAAADGFVRAEGAGVVVLKRLSAALRDNDQIWAVVRGSAIGQDGRTSSITAPNGPAQTAVIRRALAQARVAPDEVGLVETHGTGTALGDPLELEALATALAGGGADRRCLLGAVKTNLGHLEAAAGVVGLIKTALSLHHGLVPPVLHQRRRNPRIDLSGTPFVIPTVPAPLPDGVAGVSSFGFGGALAHAVLGPAPAVAAAAPAAGPRLVVVTARARQALTELAGAYADSLGAGGLTLADLAHTTLRRRDLHPYRAAVVADTEADAAAALRRVSPAPALDEPGVAFVFPGQGALTPGTAKELYAQEPVFRAAVAECDGEFRAAMGWSPADALFGAGEDLTDTRHAQAARFTVQVGLAAVWRSWGLRPSAVVGQSLGEVAAAYVSGALDLADAVRVVVARGALMARLDGHGASAVVELPAADAARSGLAVAGVLSPTTTLLSGSPDVLRPVLDDLVADGVFTHELRDVRVAFHSPEVAALAPELTAALAGITPRKPHIPFVSTVTGAEETHLDAAYWARNLAEPFDLPTAVRHASVRCFVEVSSHPALRRAITATDEDAVVVGSLTRAEPDRRALLAAAGTLITAGVALDPAALAPDGRPARLPGYPWQREDAWLPPRPVRRTPEVPTVVEPPVAEPDPEPAVVVAVPPAEPGDELEEVLRELWADALAVEPELIGLDTNFFQLGGNSLKGFGLVRQISERLDVRIPMDQVADLLTIRDLADHIRTLRTPAPIVIPAVIPDDTPRVTEDRFEPFPLLPIQRAYWVGQSMALGGVPARHYLEYETEDVDLDRLEAAWNRLIHRHEMLRAVVDPDGRQRILPEVPHYRIERTHVSDDTTLTDLRARLADPGRGSAEWPLFDVHATTFPDGATRVHLAVDMVACDGRSFAILSDEWQLLHREPAAELPPLDLSFRDVVLDYERADRTAADEYWRPRLAELPPPPQLPWAREPDTLGRPTFTRRAARLDRERWQRLRAATADAGISPSALLLAVYAEVLGTWSANPEFCVNVTTFTLRTVHPAGNSIVGDFTSNVPVAVDAAGAPTLRDRAKAVQRRLWSDVQHVGRSGVELVAEANALRGDDAFRLGVPYVFTSLLTNDDPARGAEPPVPFGWFGKRVHSVAQTPQVLVDLQVMADRGELVLDVDTIDEMFPPGLPDVLVDALVGLVRELADDPRAWDRPPLSLIPADQLTARRDANRTDAPVPAGGLHEPFVRVARTEPDLVAVRTPTRTLTYGELDRASEHVADRLADAGVVRGDLVAVTMRKGWEQVVAVLAVLKAGAAYVPIDPDLPVARRQHLLARTEATAVLTQPGLPADDGPPALVVDGTGAEPRERPGPAGDDIAYVIFTSGSTGEPKGVVIHHRAALNTVVDINSRFAVAPGDAVLGLSSLSFDLSVYDVFGILAAGATVVLPDPDRAHDPEHWADLVTAHDVSLWNSVPALYGLYVDHLARSGSPAPTLRDVLLSGDWIPLTLPERSRVVAPDTALTSLGGATEAAIWSISHPVGELDPAWPSVPYGRPLTNQRFHVVNAAGAHCPDWVPGELRIAGVGVASGYHGDEERTRASFPVDRRTGERQYRTGDLGRYRPDGTIEFLGRADSQVKVQGHRIELGEIEAALSALPGVAEAVVVVLGARDANRTLAAHVVAEELTAQEVRTHLAARLPAYMVPPTITFWPALPLTGNGKVDRARLVAAGAGTPATEDTPRSGGEPTTPVEQTLAAIWRDVLDRPRIGVHDRFFELGGDSVLGIQVVSRAARAGIKLTPRDLFEHQTVAELAAAARIETAAPARQPLEGPVPLLPIQRWLLDLDLAEPAHFTQTLLLEPVDGALDADRLTAALEAAFDRHDATRLRFRRDAVAWTQYYAAESGVVVEQLRAPDSGAVPGFVRRVAEDRSAALDLTDGPLVRAVVLVADEGAVAVLVTAHHLVVDGVSWQILFDDVAAAYAGTSLPPVETGFGAYAHALADRPVPVAEADVWAARLAAVTPAPPAGPERQAATVTRTLDEATTADLLTKAGSAYRTGVDELLLTALARTVGRPGDGTLLVDVEGHGRATPGLPDVSGTVGWFTTITPVALTVDPDLEAGEAIVAVKESVRALPGGAEMLHADWPRAGIVLNYLGRLDGIGSGLLRIANGVAGRTSAPDNRRPWALEIDCRVLAGRFHVSWTYDGDRRSREAAEAAVDRFVAELDGLVRHCVTPGAGRYTPSDFPLAALTDTALATVLDQFRRARQDEEMRS